jgi:hypothetical protein
MNDECAPVPSPTTCSGRCRHPRQVFMNSVLPAQHTPGHTRLMAQLQREAHQLAAQGAAPPRAASAPPLPCAWIELALVASVGSGGRCPGFSSCVWYSHVFGHRVSGTCVHSSSSGRPCLCSARNPGSADTLVWHHSLCSPHGALYYVPATKGKCGVTVRSVTCPLSLVL